MSILHNAKILIVDDESKTCSLLREFFEARYDVEVAFSGTEALRKIEEFRPDCVLLDIRMPDMDGREALKSAKTSYPELKVIMVTAERDAGLVAECLKLGAFAYLAKPVDLERLDSHVKSALGHT